MLDNKERKAIFVEYNSKRIPLHENDTAQGAKIFCSDWDNTVTNVHCHNKLAKATKEGRYEEEYRALLSADNVPNKEELRATYSAIINSGNRLAITSYSLYPEFMYDKLQAIGLTPDELSKVTIVSGLPPTGERAELGKSQHMKAACLSFGVSPENVNVVLIDDDDKNIAKANKDAQNKVFASVVAIPCHDSNGREHLDQLQQTFAQAQKQNKEPIPLPNSDIKGAFMSPRNIVLRDDVGALNKSSELMNKLKTEVNKPIDNAGNTLLHLCESKEMAALLLKAGADPRIKNNNGHTPAQIAEEKALATGNSGLSTYLKDKENNPAQPRPALKRTEAQTNLSNQVKEEAAKALSDVPKSALRGGTHAASHTSNVSHTKGKGGMSLE